MIEKSDKAVECKVKGTLGIQCRNGDVKFSLYPDAAYLCPEKQNAVLYPIEAESAQSQTAYMEKLEDNKLIVDKIESSMSELKGYLVQLALQNKPVELFVSIKPKECMITGLRYPVS